MIPRPPAIPASLGAIVMLAGLGLIYWSLVGFGVLQTTKAVSVAAIPTGTTATSAAGGGGGKPPLTS